MNDFSPRVYKEILRLDLGYFAQLCFCKLNPQAAFLPNWHIEVIAAKLAAVRAGRIRRLIINLPPRHLKSLLASIAFPAWCLGHDPSAQILLGMLRDIEGHAEAGAADPDLFTEADAQIIQRIRARLRGEKE